MKNNIILRLFTAAAALLLLCTAPVSAAGITAETAAEDIIGYNLKKSGAGSIQQWLDGNLSDTAGSSEGYVLALKKYAPTLDYSGCADAFAAYSESDGFTSAAASRQKTALALIACGRKSGGYLDTALEDTLGKQGLMTYVYGLHLINNGIPGSEKKATQTVKTLLERQLSDGGWALAGKNGDVDITAMTLQALAPYYGKSTAVKKAADSALGFLSRSQQFDGGYKSYGTETSESASQTAVALCALGIDVFSDSRFIKNGNTVIDGILKFRLDDGSFCHKTGEGTNGMATEQAFAAFTAVIKGVNIMLFGGSVPALDESALTSDSSVSSDTQGGGTAGKPSGSSSESADKENTASSGSASVSGDGSSVQSGSVSPSDSSENGAPGEGTDSPYSPEDSSSETSGGSGVSSEPDAEKGFPAAASVIIIVLAAGAAAALVILKVKHKI